MGKATAITVLVIMLLMYIPAPGLHHTARESSLSTIPGEIFVHAYEVHNLSARSANATLKVTVEADNDPPEAVLLGPANGAVIGEDHVILDWEATDIDSALDTISFDLYLGSGEEPVLHSSDITGTNFTLHDLLNGEEYRWYVLPDDGGDTGPCLNGTWNFTVELGVPVPVVRLISPPSGSIRSERDVSLTWELQDWEGIEPVYTVYLGSTPDDLARIGVTYRPWYDVLDLEDNTAYHWKVIPSAGPVLGKCMSGVWKFTVNLTWEAIFSLDCRLDHETINVIPGREFQFNATLSNTGNVHAIVSVSVEGLLSGFLRFDKTVVVGPGKNEMARFLLDISPLVLEGDYEFTIILSHDEGYFNYTLPVRVLPYDGVIPGNGGGEGGTGKNDNAWEKMGSLTLSLWAAAAVLFLLVVISLILLGRKKKRYGAGKAEKRARGVAAVPERERGDGATGTHGGVGVSPSRKQPGCLPGYLPSGTAKAGGKKGPAHVEREKTTAGHIPSGKTGGRKNADSTASAAAGESSGGMGSGPKILGDERGFGLTDVLLVYVDGRLINSIHFDTEGGIHLDEEAVRRLLQAITDFIKDTFKEDSGGLKALQHGKKNIYLERGVGMYLAVVFVGDPPAQLREKMRYLLIRLWETYKYKLKVWNGTPEGLDGLDDMLKRLMEAREMGKEMEMESAADRGNEDAYGDEVGSEEWRVEEEKPGARGKVVAAIASESTICGVCFGVIKTGLVMLTCPCGKRYHKSCGDRMNRCPKCGMSLTVEEALMVREPEDAAPTLAEHPGKPPLPVSGELMILDDAVKGAGRQEEFRIDL